MTKFDISSLDFRSIVPDNRVVAIRAYPPFAEAEDTGPLRGTMQRPQRLKAWPLKGIAETDERAQGSQGWERGLRGPLHEGIKAWGMPTIPLMKSLAYARLLLYRGQRSPARREFRQTEEEGLS